VSSATQCGHWAYAWIDSITVEKKRRRGKEEENKKERRRKEEEKRSGEFGEQELKKEMADDVLKTVKRKRRKLGVKVSHLLVFRMRVSVR
jgi:hypothetical protein